MNFRPGLRLALVAIYHAAGAGQAYPQWVEDSIQVPGAWVRSLAYNSREGVFLEASAQGWRQSLTSD